MLKLIFFLTQKLGKCSHLQPNGLKNPIQISYKKTATNKLKYKKKKTKKQKTKPANSSINGGKATTGVCRAHARE
jgi:hypothetical protein